MAFLLIAIFVTNLFPNTEGSGIPELKSVLAGVSIYRYLTLRILIAKYFALFLACNSGLFIGKEGPFVHIAAAVANNITKLSIFRRLHKKNTFRKQLLQVATGIGIVATFGTPLGGTLYSIEVISTLFQVSNLWKTLFCAIIAGCTLQIEYGGLSLNPYPRTKFNFDDTKLDFYTVVLYILLGLVGAIIGIIQIKITKQFIIFRKYISKKSNIVSKYFYTMVALVITLVFIITFSPFTLFQEQTIKQLFLIRTNQELFDEIDLKYYELVILFITRLLLTGMSTTAHIPSGLFVPMFICGGIFGRIFSIVKVIIPSEHSDNALSIVGAAVLVSSTTHTLAIILIVFELTGCIKLLYPMLISISTAYIVSKYFTISIYYIILHIKNLEFLPKLLNPEMYSKKAYQIMDDDIPYIQKTNTLRDIIQILKKVNCQIMALPLIDNLNDYKLIGSIQTANLIDYLHQEHKYYLESQRRTSGDVSQIQTQSKFRNTSRNYRSQMLTSVVFMDNIQKDIQEVELVPSNDPFWEIQINLAHPRLNLNKAPFIVQARTNVANLHFLFSMLGLVQTFVVHHGKLLGRINIQSFNKKSMKNSLLLMSET